VFELGAEEVEGGSWGWPVVMVVDGGGGGIVPKKGKSYVSEISISSITTNYTNCTNCTSYHILHIRGRVRLITLLTSSSQGRISSTSNPFPSPSSSFSRSRSSSSFSLASINLNRSSCAELSFLLLRSLWSASSSISSSPSSSFAGSFGGKDEEEEDEGESWEEGGRPDPGLFVIAVASSDVPFSSSTSGGGGKKSSESSTMFNLKDCSGFFSSEVSPRPRFDSISHPEKKRSVLTVWYPRAGTRNGSLATQAPLLLFHITAQPDVTRLFLMILRSYDDSSTTTTATWKDSVWADTHPEEDMLVMNRSIMYRIIEQVDSL
jgi:hypothetical protein